MRRWQRAAVDEPASFSTPSGGHGPVGDNPADLRKDSRVDLMTTRMRQFYHLSTTLPQLVGQLLSHSSCDHRIPITIGDDHQGSTKISGWGFGVRNHSRQQHHACQQIRPRQQHCGGDVSSVGESHSYQRSLLYPVRRAGFHHKFSKIIRPAPQVLLIEDSLTYPTEEPRHAVLQDRPAYRKHRSTRRKMIT